METKEITPAQFVEEWLPKSEELWRDFIAKDNTHTVSPNTAKMMFTMKYFPEALENFRESVWRQACEMMREKCSLRVNDIFLPREVGIVVRTHIQITSIPEITESKKE